MSKKEKTTEGTLLSPRKVSKKKVDKKPQKAEMPRREREYTFDQWAIRRGIKRHHLRGLRAFVSDAEKPRALQAWDVCFKDY